VARLAHGDCEASLAERRSAGSIAAVGVRSGLTLLDHVIVVGTGGYASTFRGRP
jgi:hypothetical protein